MELIDPMCRVAGPKQLKIIFLKCEMDKHILHKCVENTTGTSTLHYDEAKEVI